MMSTGPHRVAVLALPAVIPLELGIAAEIFGRDPHYRLTVCAEGRSASLPGSGLTVNTPAGLEELKRAETVIIPGYEDADATVSTAVLDAINAAHARGLRVPADVSITGWDDLPMAAWNICQLTTVRQSMEEMARTAARLLVDRIEGRAGADPRRILFEPELVLRATLGPPSTTDG